MELVDCGDSGILVEFSKDFSKTAWQKAHYVANLINESNVKGILGAIPTYCSVYIHYNCIQINNKQIKDFVKRSIQEFDSTRCFHKSPQRFRIPVVFGGEYGEDLENVGLQLSMSAEQVIDLFCSKHYQIVCIGSPVGVPLLDAPPFNKKIKRLETPRTKVPNGSIGLGGTQANIYTLDSPGGWQLIGKTPVQLINLEDSPPAPYKAGDYLEFFPIKEGEYEKYKGQSVDELKVETE